MKYVSSRRASLFWAFALLVGMLASGAVQAQTVTIAPDSPTVGNCYPFGGGGNEWPPYAGFVYQNVPAFSLGIGDSFAFDLGVPNDTAIQLQIDLAATTTNGGDTPDGSFITIVSNTQTPANAFGDDVIGNYELQFIAENNFDFPGGGLIIRFSNPSAAYAADNSCDQVMVYGFTSDTSGYFLERFYRDADGVPPWTETNEDSIGAFQVNGTGIVAAENIPVPTMTVYGLILTALGLLLLAGRHFHVSARRR